MDKPTLSVWNLGAELFGPFVQTHGIGKAVRPQLRLEPLLDGPVDDEEQRRGTYSQNQAYQLRRLVLGLLSPTAIILCPKLGWVKGTIVVIGSVQPVVDKDIYTAMSPRSSWGFGGATCVSLRWNQVQRCLQFLGVFLISVIERVDIDLGTRS